MKRKFNVTFIHTEKKIFKTFSALVRKHHGTAIKIAEIVKNSKISRTTFYRHHRTINDLTTTTEQRTLDNFAPTIEALQKSQSTMHIVFFRLLIYIRQNREYFQMSIELGNDRTLIGLLDQLRPIITKRWTNYGNADYIYTIYSHEVIAIIKRWYYHDKFSEPAIDQHINTILQITKTASSRLNNLPKD